MARAATAPVGEGFVVTPSDLAFILKQIKIGEHHADTFTAANPCGTLVGPGPDQIPDALTSYGLRTVDGSCNNLIPGRENFGAADAPFPRLTTPVFKDAEPITPSFPVGAPGPTSYALKTGSVIDSQPRVISNLIVDQTSTNPAAVAAAGVPIRSQGNPGLHPCTTDPAPNADPPIIGVPAGCVPSFQTLNIPNVTTDIGLSPPYNSLFTFFGQFFDHGVDQTVKGGGTVFVPLHADDPLIAGPDHIFGNADDLSPNLRFMVLTRAQNQPGPDGIQGTADDVQNASNTDSPWVDQSQTYSSHASHQVFLREYVDNSAGQPVSTGNLLGGLPAGQTYPGSPDGQTGMATWASLKAQAADLLGLRLVDRDVTNIPMIATDPYGKFLPGPLRGLPQYVTASGLVEGDTANPVFVPPDTLHFDTPFLTDIAHNADPSAQDSDNNPSTPPAFPTPDSDTVASADFAHQPPGTYDNEMLNAHFCAGDGRVNENIALTTIHQIFHSEHDRLIADFKNTLTNDTSTAGVAALAQWRLTTGTPDGWNGERLFQAARFVNEMEYQHIVFEEFARKVQPAIPVFRAYSPEINPAIHAEFAQAVYRFGHSMLDETVARTNVDPVTGDETDNSIPLLTAFTNPPEYFNGGTAGTLTPERAAGSIVMGSSDQVGNELDEFVTETLRNNLLGLPLDLATLNITRAREAGIPPLNDVRRQIFSATNDGQLKPYTSWADFGQNIKHPESLINFMAAYGLHPSITSQSTLAGKRAAAKAIVNPAPTDTTPIPADASDFMFGTGAWASTASGLTITGVDDVDLWVGGLAEKTSIFGGLLGSTFNYVFENQLTDLQNGDRFYYLARTPGMNLLSQLEGNSFAELIQRNTDGTNTLKADAFATADCKFQLGNLAGTADGFAAQAALSGDGSTVTDDPTTACDESRLLMRQPDGTIQYRQVNSVDPVGINKQSVYNGTPGVDRITGGSDNDTIWGGAGDDILDGGGDDDVVLGGEGNDTIWGGAGNDILKGGPGNDAVDGGIGNDLILGGNGQDFTNGGANDNETFGGPGDDFIIAGTGNGNNVAYGGPGDDWTQGGAGQNLLIGDNGAPFLDDPAQTTPGNDILIGQPGDNTYNAEGGDDIMAATSGIDRFVGSAGFDWAIHQYDTVPANDDMMINQNLRGLPAVPNRDAWQETEAVSGGPLNDVIRGDNTVPSTIGGAGFTGCDVLDQAGVDRISGLAALLPPLTGALAPVIAASMPKACPLSGPIWGEGNILLGGAGSDTIEGRGGNDIIDGDKYLSVRISVRTDPANPATEIGSTDLMEHQYLRDAAGALTGPTLQAAVFAGKVDPGNLVSVREIKSPVAGTDTSAVDTAVYSGPSSNYSIAAIPATGTTQAGVTVTQTGPNVTGQTVSDGVDTLRNIELIQFSDKTVPVVMPGAPIIGTATTSPGSATVSWTAPPSGWLAITGYSVRVVNPANAQVGALRPAAAGATSLTITGLVAGTTYTFQASALNMFGAGPLSAESNPVTAEPAPVTPAATAPGAPAVGSATAGNATATLSWTAPASDGGSAITGYAIIAVDTAGNPAASAIATPTATTATVTGLTNTHSYRLQVLAYNAAGTGALSAPSNTVTPTAPPPTATVPKAPTIGIPTRGNASALVRWTAPANGGSAMTGYWVRVLNAANTQVGALRPATAGATSLRVTGLVNGTPVRFQVQARNAIGTGALSARSNTITPAKAPGPPRIGTAQWGWVGWRLTAVARWTPPVSTGGSTITGYVVTAIRINANGTIGRQTTSAVQPARTRWLNMPLPAGRYRFVVRARNNVGLSPASARSNMVRAR